VPPRHSYVILPADFEEAWKQIVKRTDETLDFCALPLSLLFLLPHALADILLPLPTDR
jgi:hypothetical protein